MMNRYGLGILGLIVGGIIVWGLNGFKNPFGSSKEGKACMTAENKAGTIKAGVCVAS